MKNIIHSVLRSILAGDVIELKKSERGRKWLQEQERRKKNKEILERMRKEKIKPIAPDQELDLIEEITLEGTEEVKDHIVKVYFTEIQDYGEINIKSSMNLKDPDFDDLLDAIDQAGADLYENIIIYSDSYRKAKDLVEKVLKDISA